VGLGLGHIQQIDLDGATFRHVATSTVSSDPSIDILVLVGPNVVRLVGRRIGVHGGCIVSALGILVPARGSRATSARDVQPRRWIHTHTIRAPSVPICVLMNVVASVYVHGRAIRVVVRVEIQLRVVGDCSIVRTISTISGTCGAGRDFMDVDGVYRRGKFGDHIGLLPVCVGTASIPCWDDAYSLQLKRVDLTSLYVNTDAIRFAEVYARFGVPPFLATIHSG
jgi:hypothetical protein